MEDGIGKLSEAASPFGCNITSVREARAAAVPAAQRASVCQAPGGGRTRFRQFLVDSTARGPRRQAGLFSHQPRHRLRTQHTPLRALRPLFSGDRVKDGLLTWNVRSLQVHPFPRAQGHLYPRGLASFQAQCAPGMSTSCRAQASSVFCFLSNPYAQWGARAHNPKVTSHLLY